MAFEDDEIPHRYVASPLARLLGQFRPPCRFRSLVFTRPPIASARVAGLHYAPPISHLLGPDGSIAPARTPRNPSTVPPSIKVTPVGVVPHNPSWNPAQHRDSLTTKKIAPTGRVLGSRRRQRWEVILAPPDFARSCWLLCDPVSWGILTSDLLYSSILSTPTHESKNNHFVNHPLHPSLGDITPEDYRPSQHNTLHIPSAFLLLASSPSLARHLAQLEASSGNADLSPSSSRTTHTTQAGPGPHNLTRADRDAVAALRRLSHDVKSSIDAFECQLVKFLDRTTGSPPDSDIETDLDTESESTSEFDPELAAEEDWEVVKAPKKLAAEAERHDMLVWRIEDPFLRLAAHVLCRFYGVVSPSEGLSAQTKRGLEPGRAQLYIAPEPCLGTLGSVVRRSFLIILPTLPPHPQQGLNPIAGNV
ncbi:hypothetical protein HDU93_003772 [Gonapodya sp. JEL0774]|nr:hypothetical protein HDU93_003772 [Gonapodya sp. JEL0774]